MKLLCLINPSESILLSFIFHKLNILFSLIDKNLLFFKGYISLINESSEFNIFIISYSLFFSHKDNINIDFCQK